MAPYLVMPIVMTGQGLRSPNASATTGFGIAFTASFLGMIPMMGLDLLRYSQQWQAADIFRAAPMDGPASLCDGARRAVLCLVALPGAVILVLLVWLLSHRQISEVLLLLPGIITLPIFALIPSLGGKGVPLSVPVEEAKSAGRGLAMMGAMFISMALSGVALWAWSTGWFWWFLLIESILAVALYVALRRAVTAAKWQPQE
jgi:hypothetical protein